MAFHVQKTLLASAARTATVATADQRNRAHKGVRVHINTTADPASASIVYTIQGKDDITDDYYTLLASAAVTSVGDTFLTIYPNIAVTANVSASNVLPAVWRVNCVAADADSMTYQVTAELLA
jgi:hypothetical protein